MRTRNIVFFGKMGIIYNAKAREIEQNKNTHTNSNTSNMTRKTFPTGRLQKVWLFSSVAEG